jgi:biopolymer transport protein ExbD
MLHHHTGEDAMARSIAASPEPMSAINITPMIDVMLVLLVMLILTIPPLTHKVAIDLPRPHTGRVDPSVPHRLEIERSGALRWDGARVSDAALAGRLAAFNRDGASVLQLRTDPEARYERFDQVLATVKRANVTRLAFVGNAPLP